MIRNFAAKQLVVSLLVATGIASIACSQQVTPNAADGADGGEEKTARTSAALNDPGCGTPSAQDGTPGSQIPVPNCYNWGISGGPAKEAVPNSGCPDQAVYDLYAAPCSTPGMCKVHPVLSLQNVPTDATSCGYYSASLSVMGMLPTPGGNEEFETLYSATADFVWESHQVYVGNTTKTTTVWSCDIGPWSDPRVADFDPTVYVGVRVIGETYFKSKGASLSSPSELTLAGDTCIW